MKSNLKFYLALGDMKVVALQTENSKEIYASSTGEVSRAATLRRIKETLTV